MIGSFFKELSNGEKALIGLFLGLKLAILLMLPLTGDEAYFISWGDNLSSGYYDHPPLIGWLIYLLSFINEHYYFYRSIAFLISILVAVLLYQMILPHKGSKIALLVALVFLLSPLSLLALVLVNDVVLLAFGLLGFYSFSKALEENDAMLALLGGVFLGLAFLSKYLSAPLFVGMFAYLIVNRSSVNWKLVLLGAFTASLFVLQNLYFNWQNCWNNIVFNLFSRTEDGGFNWVYPVTFIATLMIVVPPQGVIRLLKTRSTQLPEIVKQAMYVAACFSIVFLLVSSFKRIGLHWLYLLATFTYFLFLLLPEKPLRGMLKYNALISILLAVSLLLVISQAEALFGTQTKYREALLYLQPQTICAALPVDQTIYTLSYSKNSVLDYHCADNRFHVFANTAKYGREDDKRIDYSELVAMDLLVLITRLKDLEKINRYFDSTNVQTISMAEGIDYYLVDARGFNFELYKSEQLAKIARHFYSPPDWLPAGSCEFTRKYAL